MLRICVAVAAGALGAVSLASAAAPPAETLFFDAVFTHASTAGPAANAVGHKQIAGGVLKDEAGSVIGRFGVTCLWVEKIGRDDAREHCTGWGQTRDGRVEVAGPSRASDAVHTWRIAGGTGGYGSASGTVLVRDLGETETLVTVRASGADLRAGRIPVPAVNGSFRSRAEAACSASAARLRALPQFPYTSFDPLHPQRALLRKVGRFLSGPGDGRPILSALLARLRELGNPPADGHRWQALLDARAAQLRAIARQDETALAGDSAGFVRAVRDGQGLSRRAAIAATVFDVTGCIM
jgi:hypothetical protein